MAMFTSAEFAALTGITLTNDQYTLIQRLAAGIVEAECGRTWSSDPDPITKIRRVDSSGRVVLPRPVATVDTIRNLDPDGTVGTAVAGWQFDGIDSVRLLPYELILNGPQWLSDSPTADTVEVTWTPAAQALPAPVAAVALALAVRIQGNPAGASSLSIDDYSQGFSGGAGIALLPSEKATLARYRSRGLASQSVAL